MEENIRRKVGWGNKCVTRCVRTLFRTICFVFFSSIFHLSIYDVIQTSGTSFLMKYYKVWSISIIDRVRHSMV